jgi:protein SCO1/2
MDERALPASRPVSWRRARRLLVLGAAALACAPTVAHERGRHDDSSISVKRVSLGAVPKVKVVSMRGAPGHLDEELGTDDAPVLVNFVFTTCSTICSMQTAVLAELQRQLAARGQALRMVSITIDPANDTPEQLLRFAKNFNAQPGWEFLTGDFDDLVRVQSFFDVYRGSKAAHPAVVMLRGKRREWTRVEGMPTPANLLSLVQAVALKG